MRLGRLCHDVELLGRGRSSVGERCEAQVAQAGATCVHVGGDVFDGLEAADLLTELLTLPEVLDGLLKAALSEAAELARDEQAGP